MHIDWLAVSLSDLFKPEALKERDVIAVVSPSTGWAGEIPHRYQAGKKQLEKIFNVQVVEMPHALKPLEWLADNPQARADDFMQAFADPSINAVFAAIGGGGAADLIPLIDDNVIRNNPKIFMGYSDTTVLHFACLGVGLSSFYGPSIMSGFAENNGMHGYTRQSIQNTLFSSAAIGKVPHAESWTDQRLRWEDPQNQNVTRTMKMSDGWKLLQGEGEIEGRLIGGCFETLEKMKGTEIFPSGNIWKDSILFLENSRSGSVDTTFEEGIRQYGRMGILDQVKGIMFARPGGYLPHKVKELDGVLKSVVSDEFGLKDLPIIAQMDFGHTDPKFVIPYGCLAHIDCENRQLSIIENAVLAHG